MKIRSFSLITALSLCIPLAGQATEQAKLGHHNVTLIEQDGLKFKDLDKNGKLTPYEDWRLTPLQRAQDLVTRMSLEEKAGLMMHGSVPAIGSIIGEGKAYDLPAATRMIVDEKVNTFITRLSASPQSMAEQNNKLQEIAEQTRLGIPVMISLDPRSSYLYSAKGEPEEDGLSKWAQSLGIAAIGDEALTRHYADIARQEYRLLGVTQALSPMADLSTEPRWSRFDGTFGEDPELTKRMVRGYIEGMQNGRDGLNSGSVSTVVKHWVGYGASKDGYDGHNSYGKLAVFPGNSFEQHLIPFTGAFDVKVSGVMPTYAILQNLIYKGHQVEQVGAGFNHFLLQDLLRKTYKFDGVIISDWMITDDCNEICVHGSAPGETPDPVNLAMPWGVESLTKTERFIKAVEAGIDQFGGVTDIVPLVSAVKAGKLSETRLHQSAIRLLEQKFALGLFENAYVDAALTGQLLPNKQWQAQANQSQRNALVLLEKRGNLLPLKAKSKVYLYGIDPRIAEQAGFVVVNAPEQADVAIVRTATPYEQPHKNYFFGARYHEGSLAFSADNPDLKAILAAADKVPTIVTVYIDRPAILTPVKDKASVLIANFGISDNMLFTALTDGKPFTARLPFELPSSMEDVLAQYSDKPHDSKRPLYPIGFGLN